MKILFMSDIHGIPENLEYIRKLDLKEKFDKIVVLGDLYHAGLTYSNIKEVDVNKVKDFLMQYQDKIIALRGNCDSDADIKSTDFPICNTLALIHVDGIDIYCTHGNEYNKRNHEKLNRRGVLIYGHEHFPYIEQIDEMVYVNVGSISLPRNNSKPSYAIYENQTITIYAIGGFVIDQVSFSLCDQKEPLFQKTKNI